MIEVLAALGALSEASDLQSDALKSQLSQLANTSYRQYMMVSGMAAMHSGCAVTHNSLYGMAALQNLQNAYCPSARVTPAKTGDVLKVREFRLHHHDDWKMGVTAKRYMRFDGQNWVDKAVGRIGPRTRGLRPTADKR